MAPTPTAGICASCWATATWRSPEARDHYFEHLSILADTLSGEEMLGLDNTDILTRLFHQENLRLFEPRTLRFACSCSESRTGDMLLSLGQKEVEAIIAERGSVEVQCQFCHQLYHFDAERTAALFAPRRTLH